MKSLIKFISALYLLVAFQSCVSTKMHKADQHYDNLSYHKAITIYEDIYDKSDEVGFKSRLAWSYLKTGQTDKAKETYSKIIDHPNLPHQDYLNYSKVLMSNEKYEESKKWTLKYLDLHPEDIVAQMMLSSVLSLNQRYIDTSLYEVQPIQLEDYENTFSIQKYNDGVVFNADKDLFIGRKNAWTGQSYLNLYYMEKDATGNWLPPMALKGALSGPFHDGPATFSKDGNTVYFTRSSYSLNRLETNEQKISNLKIYKAKKEGDKWKQLEELPFNSKDYSVAHPTLSKDGKTLYFVSDMPGGEGGMDLYKSELMNGNWGEPQNLGKKVNTEGNELFPYIHNDGSLYFSSNAHNTMGGLDVFITYYDGKEWARPENLNYPINTSKDDFGFNLNPDDYTGFVSSSRAGKDEVYEFSKNDPTFVLLGKARKKGAEDPVAGVTVEITDAETNEVLNTVSGEDGKFKLPLEPNKKYLLLCTKDGCFARTDKIVTKGLKYSQKFYADFEVEPIVIDKPIVLENIYYDYNKHFIREDAAKELDKLVKLLKDNPAIDIEMSSHTDSRGSDNYNMVLSSKRAYAAVRYLHKNGIDLNRLTWRGYGESKLVNECANDVSCSEEQHQQNRRTEFKVTKINPERELKLPEIGM